MNLQVSVILLFISLTGGYSLKCYSCTSLLGSCDANVTCPDGFTKCSSITVETPIIGSSTTKGCAVDCVSGTVTIAGVTSTTSCCDTDLCNAADGVYKGSFLLLVSPLLFYFLFQ
ncbi:lymphocyte antigen 6D-like [Siphateles boraxobius]|uniref:lymphocyte antigen 6D-like n=1 Tax=Siphateles boraxobius TaxID=180520 RepID=UPI0040646AB9